MMPMLIRFLTPVLLCAVLAACAAPSPRSDADTGDRRAQTLFDAGRYAEAARAWETRVETDPHRAAVFRIRAAEAWLAAGDLDTAAERLADMDPATLEPAAASRLWLARAELALARGDVMTAGWQLAEAETGDVSGLEPRINTLRQRLETTRTQPAARALKALEASVHTADFTPGTALSLLIDLPVADLRGLMRAREDDPALAPWLDLALTARAHLLDGPRLLTALESWQARWPVVGYPATQALEWVRAWRETIAWPTRIAVLLPGPGPLEAAGEALRDGLMAAWLQLPQARRPELDFHYLDNNPESAISAWFQARENSADFIIGPLRREQVERMLELDDPGLPMLLLNHPEHPPEALAIRSMLALLPEDSAEIAAIHALARDYRRALVLAQDTSWGRRVADSFAETFTAGGGQMLERAVYSPGDSDHSILLQDFLGLRRSQTRIDRVSNLLGTTAGEARPRTDADFIFLAARHDDARQLAPQLDYFGVGNLPVFASAQIHDELDREPGDTDLDGIRMAMAPWFIHGTGANDIRRQATRQYPGLDNYTLSQLHALGRDALGLVRWLDRMRTDPDLYWPGLTGRLSLRPDGRLQRDLPWSRFERGQVVGDAP